MKWNFEFTYNMHTNINIYIRDKLPLNKSDDKNLTNKFAKEKEEKSNK